MPAWALTGSPGLSAACSEALDGPAYLLAVHGGEVAGLWGGESRGRGGFVEGGGVFEDGGVAALGLEILSQACRRAPLREDFVGELGSCFGSVGVAGEVEHPAGEDVGEVDEVGGHGVTRALHDVDALPDFDPVAGEAAEGLVHGGEERDGAGAGGFAGVDHELGEEFGFFVGGHEGAGADFDVEHEGVEILGELLAHDAGGDEEGGLDGAGVVAEGVEDAVGGDDFGVWPMRAAPHCCEDCRASRGRGSWVLKPGMVSSLSRVPPVWPRLRPLIIGTKMPGSFGGGMCEAGGGEDGGDQEGGLVAYAAGGVLVDGEGVEGFGVEDLAGEAHGLGEVASSCGIEAAEEDGHEEGGDLGVGSEWVSGCGGRWRG